MRHLFELGARAAVPFHFSPRYEQRPEAVRAEMRAGWLGSECQGESAPTTSETAADPSPG
jgi:ribonuclease BN (tRNA processing enzyme)